MKNQILHLAIFKLFVFALLATENLQIHFFFESLIFNFAFWQNVVSKSNAASSSSPRCAPPPSSPPAGSCPCVRLSVRPSIRPSVRPRGPGRLGCHLAAAAPAYIIFFSLPGSAKLLLQSQSGLPNFYSSLTKTLPDCFCDYYFCLFVHSEYWTLTSF